MFKQMLATCRVSPKLLNLPPKIFLSLVPKCSSSVPSHHLPAEDLLSSRTEFSAVHQTWLGAPAHVAPSCFSWPTDQENTYWSFKAQIKYHLWEAFWDFPKSSSHFTPLPAFSSFVHSTGSLFSKTMSSGVRLPGFESLPPQLLTTRTGQVIQTLYAIVSSSIEERDDSNLLNR